MCSVLNTLSEYTHFYIYLYIYIYIYIYISHIRKILHIFYIPKNITSYTFLLVFEIVESLQCIFKEFVQRGSIFF